MNIYNSDVTITDSQFSDNQATNNGGALYIQASRGTTNLVGNNTFTGNIAWDGNGNDIYCYGSNIFINVNSPTNIQSFQVYNKMSLCEITGVEGLE